ncbi:hypothetical protein ACS0TY_012971 [Phlomoides rotata]
MAEGERVKLFVGQVPKYMTESELLDVFKEFAVVDEVRVIKDKATGVSRGCCFVICPSREEADKAVSACHDKKTLPGASSPMQIRYADGELEKLEHKLFVGMLPKTVSNAEVSSLFSQYGTITELQILEGSPQSKKGCAFIKFETKKQALAAIEALNGKHKMEGCNIPLVVKWADTEKERQARKVQKALMQVLKSQYGGLPMGYMSAFNGYGYQTPGTYGHMHYGLPSQLQNSVPPLKNALLGASPALSSRIASNYAMPLLQYPLTHPQGIAVNRKLWGSSGSLSPSTTNSQSKLSPSSGSQSEGPPGANLFIFHILQEYGDEDLAKLFEPFGKILSAKVFVDKATGISKCFGFVSYDSAAAAQEAIKRMNGFQLGGKTLKVQLKRDGKYKLGGTA